MSDGEVDTIFDTLDAWRHLPAYQLERRADIFFALYLPRVLEAELGLELHPELIPEFPLRRGLVCPGKKGPNQSKKVDYAAFDPAHRTVWLVELKTAMTSRNDTQDAYLDRACRYSFRTLVDGVREITLHTETSNRPKYLHLLRALARWGFVTLPQELGTDPARITMRSLRAVQACADAEVRVVYVQPHEDGGTARAISFETFARHVEANDDRLGQRFARSLREWSREEAGGAAPRAWGGR